MLFTKIRFCLLLTVVFPLSAQQDFKSYRQQIDGTPLAFDMVALPGGTFIMGNNRGEADEQPEHPVTVSPFWIGTHEVTWDLFELFVYKDLEVTRSTGQKVSSRVDAVTRPSKPYLDMTFGMGKQGYPALAMTQYNAIRFCKWLYARTGVFYRLPTEAEWEFAARQGQPEGELEDYAWTSRNSNNTTQKAGTRKPDRNGIYDLLGNVAEWTYDQYSPDFYASLAGKTAKDPVNVPEKLYPHVVRGGSYLSDLRYLTPTARDYSDPSWKQIDPQIPKSNWWMPDAPFVGIRLVRPLHPPSEEEILLYYDKAPIKDY
ncbi:formylglycine-generating enzyme family protein [Leadbetterella sp. DM7]|uniref:formylglycine-generating enzyme family protein n=1 Tax=Leadbetterella sp. DM7 TaxID=3235085 RepID=UPI00349E4DE2